MPMDNAHVFPTCMHTRLEASKSEDDPNGSCATQLTVVDKPTTWMVGNYAAQTNGVRWAR